MPRPRHCALLLALALLLLGPVGDVLAQDAPATAGRPHLVMVIGEDEYELERTLPAFAKQHLGDAYRVTFIHADKDNPNSFPGIEALDTADVALFGVRRRVLPRSQMETIRRYVDAGKPVVALRTSSHAFSLRNQPAPEGYVDWPEFDRDVLGGNYHNHHSNDSATLVWRVEEAADHPVLLGIPAGEFASTGSLYRTQPLAETTTLLMMGRVEGREPAEPVTWTNERPGGGRVFYSSLGHPGDFENPVFQRLLLNAINWAAGRTAPGNAASLRTDR